MKIKDCERMKAMGYLERFARNQKRNERTEVLTARLSKPLYDDFKAYCDGLGLTISEAINLLVDHELKGKRSEYERIPKEPDVLAEPTTNDDEPNTNVVEANTDVVKTKTTKQAKGARFTVKPWTVEDELPCPICGTWVSSSNFSRHSKQHGTTTHSVFTNQDYLRIAEDMIEERTRAKV
jgi:antitoxin component of RelBE/YafQ-DinJ toxin-antitoxin module